jgi:hypothetical protein
MRMLFVKERKNKSKRMRCGNDVLQLWFLGLRGRNPPQLQHLSRLMIGGYAQTTSDPMRAAEPATILQSEVGNLLQLLKD